MILEKQTEAVVHQDGETQESIGMSLDLDSAQILMQMLSKNLYSDDVGSTVRECASNALDSHRRAGVDKPIVVALKPSDSNSWEFSVEDFGIGLDADDVKNIISKYGKSTKRNSANELGMMGLGFKAPLAYCSSFYFVCRKNGVERKYMMYEGEDVNTIDLLYETPTDKPNGVKVIVPVNRYDRSNFINKIREQLAYFENVYFDVEGIDNNFTIHRGEHFQWSPLSGDHKLHICLDNVYYPIDFGKLDISTIGFPVGLRFSLTDGIFPTPNRESIRYTKEAKEIILDKIKHVADWFVSKYNDTIQDTDNIISIMNHYSDENRYIDMFSHKYDVNCLLQYATIPFKSPKLKGVNILDLKALHRNKDYILNEYVVKFKIDRSKWRECKRYWDMDVRIKDMTTDRHFLFEEKISGKKKEYLKEIYGGDTGWQKNKLFLKKTKSFKLGKLTGAPDYDTYMDILGLRKIQRHLWRAAIKEFQYIVGLYINPLKKVEDIDIPQNWIDSKKKLKISISGVSGPKVRRVKLQGEIIGKQLSDLERSVDGKNSKLVSTTYRLENMHKMPSLYVYGSQENAEKMDKLYSIFKKQRVYFVVFSERELKNMAKLDFHNWITFDKFMKGDNKPFRRMMTAYLIDKLSDDYSAVFNRVEKMKDISEALHAKLEVLESYIAKHHTSSRDKLYEAVLPIAQENNLFDMEIYPIYLEIKALLDKLPFINSLFYHMSRWNGSSEIDAKLIDVCIDMFKYHRTKVDWKHYKIKLAGDVQLPETTSEEELENLLED